MTDTELIYKALAGQVVDVYRNLRDQCWSVRAIHGPNKGRVIAHVHSLNLQDCEFRVSEAGRQRVLRERRKNVHACIRGTVVASEAGKYTLVRYRPYDYKYFFVASDCQEYLPVFTATRAHLDPDGHMFSKQYS